MNLKEIENIKEQAELLITKIIQKTESETGCECAGVDLFIDVENNNKILIDLDLRIKSKIIDKLD